MNRQPSLAPVLSSLALSSLVLSSLVLAGCSTADPRGLEAREDLERVRRAVAADLAKAGVPELGLKLYVAPVAVSCPEEDWKEESPRRYGMRVDRQRLAEEVGWALGPSFDRVKVHPNARDGREDVERAAFEGGFDAVLFPRVVRWDAVFVETNGWWWPNALFLYWYFYFPSWVIADEVYGADLAVRYDVEAVRSERAIPGLQGREVALDSRRSVVVEGQEQPGEPRLALDDLDRGLSILGTYRPGKLDPDQWAKVQGLLEPYARRFAARALVQDLARGLAEFRARPEDERARALAALHALVVGVGEYGPNDSCRHADHDALAVSAWLTGAPDEAAIGSSSGATPPKLVRTLTNGNATRPAIEKALGTLAERARAEDTVVVFFAGRGVRCAGDGLAGLGLECRSDGSGQDPVLGLDALEKALAGVKAARKVVVLDASFAGDPRGRGGEGPRGQAWTAASFAAALRRLAPGGGTVVAAAGPDEPVLAFEPVGHGLLTYALLEGLEGAADTDGKPGVSWGELARHVEMTVPALSVLAGGAPQRPVFLATSPDEAALSAGK